MRKRWIPVLFLTGFLVATVTARPGAVAVNREPQSACTADEDRLRTARAIPQHILAITTPFGTIQIF